jgi:6-phosphogluconolactonase (cycloisomerase 2 family)
MSAPAAWLAYVGCRTTRERNAQGLGIGVFRVSDGRPWQRLQLVEGLRNPSFLCLHPGVPMLYAVHGDSSEISSFAIAPDGTLTLAATRTTHGRNPVHLALTPSMRWMLVANYATGNVVSMRVGEDGALAAVAAEVSLPGANGPHPQQDGSHPHQICFTPDGALAMVPDKGLDKVFALAINEDTGHLRIAAAAPMPQGSGPRHMSFHPSLPIAYVVGELDRTVIVCRYEAGTGLLHSVRATSTVPEACSSGSAAGILVSADGRTLVVSNRGHDSLALFPLGEDGALGTPSWAAAGRTPRFITSLPGGPLLVAREDGHSLAVSDPQEAGLDTVFKDVVQTGSPVCVVFRKANP